MAGDCGLNALSLLPENVLPQWQQKIMRVDIMTTHWIQLFFARSAIFCRYWTCTFSGRNNQAIGAEVVCHFHPTLSVILSAFSPYFVITRDLMNQKALMVLFSK